MNIATHYAYFGNLTGQGSQRFFLLSTNAFHYEFRSEDITHAEKLPSIVSMEGEATPIAHIWVKQGSIGMYSTHFLVENHTVMTQAKTRLP